jgi:hypothetical protein
MKYFSRLVFKSKRYTKGTQAELTFPNGYGASVITGGYGNERAPYELGVVKGGSLDYSTEITGDVEGYQTAEQIDVLLQRIEAL